MNAYLDIRSALDDPFTLELPSVPQFYISQTNGNQDDALLQELESLKNERDQFKQEAEKWENDMEQIKEERKQENEAWQKERDKWKQEAEKSASIRHVLLQSNHKLQQEIRRLKNEQYKFKQEAEKRDQDMQKAKKQWKEIENKMDQEIEVLKIEAENWKKQQVSAFKETDKYFVVTFRLAGNGENCDKITRSRAQNSQSSKQQKWISQNSRVG